MKVLVTAFKPFNNFNNNYSSEVLNYIKDVDKLIIDVNYDKSYLEILDSYDLNDYDLVIALGEARMRKELTLELSAKNISSCSIADNSGVYKKDEIIISNGDSILQTKVNLNNVDGLVLYSNDAGKFVCNNLYYHLLYNHQNKALFIHIPECNNCVDEYKKYAKTINLIINTILDKKEC